MDLCQQCFFLLRCVLACNEPRSAPLFHSVQVFVAWISHVIAGVTIIIAAQTTQMFLVATRYTDRHGTTQIVCYHQAEVSLHLQLVHISTDRE